MQPWCWANVRLRQAFTCLWDSEPVLACPDQGVFEILSDHIYSANAHACVLKYLARGCAGERIAYDYVVIQELRIQ